MRRCARIATALLVAQIATSAVASAITLRAHAEVVTERTHLGELADLGDAAEAWGNLVMWPSPSPCQTVHLKRAAVMERLRELHASKSESFDWKGAEQIDIHRSCQRVEPEQLIGTARDTLAAWLRPRVERFDLTPLVLAAIELPLGRISLVAREWPANQPFSARMQVWVEVGVDGREIRSVPVAFSVHAYRTAWVATRDVAAEQPIGGASLEQRLVDIAQERIEPMVEMPPGSRLRKPLLAGQALTARHVEVVPAIVRGSAVKLRSRLGAIGIEARAEALQDGRPGQLVWVRVASATGPIRARVVEAGVVEIQDE